MNITVLGVLEFNSIAIGIKSLDEMIKASPINIIEAKTICPGKYLILISGDVASVELSINKGKEIGAGYIVDELFLPMVHEDIIPAIKGKNKCDDWNAIGIIETNSVISSIQASDIAAKISNVKILEIRLAIGFGGKSYVKMLGELNDVEIAVGSGIIPAERKGLLCSNIIIPRPHEELKKYFM